VEKIVTIVPCRYPDMTINQKRKALGNIPYVARMLGVSAIELRQIEASISPDAKWHVKLNELLDKLTTFEIGDTLSFKTWFNQVSLGYYYVTYEGPGELTISSKNVRVDSCYTFSKTSMYSFIMDGNIQRPLAA